MSAMGNGMTGSEAVTVYFGGDAHEAWTNDGLVVSYTGRLPVLAVNEGGRERAYAPRPVRAGDVKADYNESARSAELAARLNSGAVPALTRAYFIAAARAARAAASVERISDLPSKLHCELSGGLDAIILPELLRLLLDERRASWDEAMGVVSECFDLRMAGSATPGAVPLGAIAALQQRTASLIRAVNEKLCSRLWDTWPGDWRRIGESAVIRDGEVCTETLCAEMCSRIFCTKERRASSLRSMYILSPARFTDI